MKIRAAHREGEWLARFEKLVRYVQAQSMTSTIAHCTNCRMWPCTCMTRTTRNHLPVGLKWFSAETVRHTSNMVKQLLLCLSTFYLFPLDTALNSSANPAPTECEDSSVLEHILPKSLEEGKNLEDDESFINLAVIMTNMAAGDEISETIFKHLDLYLSNLVRHLFQDSRLRLIIISDAKLFSHLRTHLKMLVNIH